MTENEIHEEFIKIQANNLKKLMAELEQTRKERDWLLNHMDEENCPPNKNEYSCWKTLTDIVKTDCKKCWLQAAKEATCQKD